MRTLILTIVAIFTFGFTNAQVALQDTTKKETIKVIYPVAQVADTALLQALVVTELNKPLIAKEYYVITEYWLFAKDTKKAPEAFKQRVVEKLTGILVSDFINNKVWVKEVPRNGKRQ